jgi:hypothetical protein
MRSNVKRKLGIGAAALAAAAFAGGAYAATQGSSNPRQAFLDDVAKRLNVTPAQLRAALDGAFLDRLQAAVAAGRLTQAQANAIKQRLQHGALPPLGFGPRLRGDHLFRGGGPFGPPGPGGMHAPGHGALAAAAGYLGLSRAQLIAGLESGKSLAQLASSRGKSVAGLKAAMIAAIKTRLDRAVAAGRLTPAQEKRILSRLSTRLDQEINRSGLRPLPRPLSPMPDRDRDGGPPGAALVPAPPGAPTDAQPGSPSPAY